MKSAENAHSPTSGRGLWNFFASVRLTVGVLVALAATSVIGTLVPQNESPDMYFKAYGEVVYRIFYALNIFDMYHSWWFQFLLVLLMVNIIVCSLDRLSSLWSVIFVKIPSFSLSRFTHSSAQSSFEDERNPDEMTSAAERAIRRRFSYHRTEAVDGGFIVFAEKNRWTRLGVYIVHLSVVLLLVGGLVGSLLGFDGFITIPVGESVQSIRLRNTNASHPLGFEIRCDDFSLSHYENGMPKEYRSKLVILKNGEEKYRKDVIVNDPLRYEGISIYQSSYGTLPPDIRNLSENGVKLSFTSKESNMVYAKKAKPGERIDLPEGRGTFMVTDLKANHLFMGQRDLGLTVVGRIEPSEGNPSDVFLPVRFSRFDMMRKDPYFVISVEDIAERYYTGLQVAKDPGVPLVYAGFLLMIVGCFITFFMSHQRICVQVTEQKGKSRVLVSGVSNKNPTAMDRLVGRITRSLSGADTPAPLSTGKTG